VEVTAIAPVDTSRGEKRTK